jgi:hypothetical protein
MGQLPAREHFCCTPESLLLNLLTLLRSLLTLLPHLSRYCLRFVRTSLTRCDYLPDTSLRRLLPGLLFGTKTNLSL